MAGPRAFSIENLMGGLLNEIIGRRNNVEGAKLSVTRSIDPKGLYRDVSCTVLPPRRVMEIEKTGRQRENNENRKQEA